MRVAHHSRISKVVIDVPSEEHDRELAFWQAATGQELRHYERFPEYHGSVLPGDDMGLLIQRLGEGGSRVHLDIHTDNLEAEVSRLESLGAQQVQRLNFWCVMRDPAGLLFCVVETASRDLDETNSRRWD